MDPIVVVECILPPPKKIVRLDHTVGEDPAASLRLTQAALQRVVSEATLTSKSENFVGEP